MSKTFNVNSGTKIVLLDNLKKYFHTCEKNGRKTHTKKSQQVHQNALLSIRIQPPSDNIVFVHKTIIILVCFLIQINQTIGAQAYRHNRPSQKPGPTKTFESKCKQLGIKTGES